MSFDVDVYFANLPPDFVPKWEAALRELKIPMTVLIPPAWEKEGLWYLLDKPTDKPEEGFEIYAKPLGPKWREGTGEEKFKPDELELLSKARYKAYITGRLASGNAMLMIAGALAKAVDGVMWDPQGAAFEPVFDRDMAASSRGAKGPKGSPTLVERGYYDASLAWAVAKAAAAYEDRAKAKKSAPPAAPPAEGSGGLGWVLGVLGLVAIGGIAKLVQRKRENDKP